MSKKKKIACTNPRLDHLLREAKSDDLTKPGRELDHQLFQAHLDECTACRNSMLDHASETAIEQVAAGVKLVEPFGVAFDRGGAFACVSVLASALPGSARSDWCESEMCTV